MMLKQRLARVLMVTVVVGTGARCNKPEITGIEIVPSKVMVGSANSATTFKLEARLWGGPSDDRWSIDGEDGYKNVHWKSSQSWLHISDDGYEATASIDPNIAPTGSAFVTIQAGGKKTEPGAEIKVIPQSVSGSDVLTSKYSPAEVPSVVVVNGKRNVAGPCSVTLSAYVRRAVVGPVAAPCDGSDGSWGAAVLAIDQGTTFMPVGWTIDGDPVKAEVNQGPLRTIPVALRIMVAPNELVSTDPAVLQDDVLAIALADLAVANALLAENRTGIRLGLIDTQKIPVGGPTLIGDCVAGDALPGTVDYPGVLNVYYLNRLGNFRALTCNRHKERPEDVIYVAWEENPHFSTTLMHEIGHSLGQVTPGDGHTEFVGGLDGTNVMASGEHHDNPSGRHSLTIGQVFRMNAESASWLNLAKDLSDPPQDVRPAPTTRLDCQCGHQDPAGRCPRVREDVTAPSGTPSVAMPWHCYDEVRLVPMESGTEGTIPNDESPVAIVAGRIWRGFPGCENDRPASSRREFGVTYLVIDNIARAGSCPSWVAVFFRGAGVVHQSLDGALRIWTPSRDRGLVKYGVPPKKPVHVHVFNAPADVDQDIEFAGETFGPTNRSGIDLLFAPPATGTCPQGSPSVSNIYLCYGATGPSEANILAAGVVKVRSNPRIESTAAHYIGRVLGLPVVSAPDEGLFPSNVMRRRPEDRGPRLTLGQVYHLHVGFGSLPACTTGNCPSLAADILR